MKQMVFRKIDFKTNYSSKITWYHGIIEHFTMDPEILSIYLVNDCLYDEFANAGIQYIFTGDMHANYIAELQLQLEINYMILKLDQLLLILHQSVLLQLTVKLQMIR